MNCTEQNKIIGKKTRNSTKLFFSMNLLMNNLDSLICLFKNATVTEKIQRRETDLMKLVLIQVVPFSMSPVFSSHKVCHIIMAWNQYRRYGHLTIFFFSSMWLYFYSRNTLSILHFCLFSSSMHKQVQNS